MLSASLSPRLADLERRCEPHLLGRTAYVAVQTVAELRFGALQAGWGEVRMAALERLLRAVAIVAIDDDLVWVHARLRLECRRAGHAIAAKVHAADLWVAASALAHDLPLVTDDRTFVGTPGLTVVTEAP